MSEVLSYAALKADRDAQQKRADALAVESIGLRHIAERIVNNLYAAGYEPEENSIHPWKSLIFDAEKALETPATDAALAAIEARGVEKFADMCREKSKLATTADSCAGWKNCSVHASSFAIRLREAK